MQLINKESLNLTQDVLRLLDELDRQEQVSRLQAATPERAAQMNCFEPGHVGF